MKNDATNHPLNPNISSLYREAALENLDPFYSPQLKRQKTWIEAHPLALG